MNGRRLTLSIIILVQAPLALAGLWNGDCREPRVFPDAAVNVVVFPYTYRGSDLQLLTASKNIGILLQLNTLLSLVKYRSVGVVQLVDFYPGSGSCDQGVVEAKVLGRGNNKYQVGQGKAVAFLWGRIYQENNEIFVRSYLRFLRRGTDEFVSLSVGGFRFSGAIPTQSVSFGAAKLTVDQIQQIQDQFEQSAKVYDRPNGNATGRQLHVDMRSSEQRGFAFQVLEVSQGW